MEFTSFKILLNWWQEEAEMEGLIEEQVKQVDQVNNLAIWNLSEMECQFVYDQINIIINLTVITLSDFPFRNTKFQIEFISCVKWD